MVVGCGLQSHFRVQPNHCAEVVLCCVVVWVVTITLTDLFLKPLLCGSSGGSGGSWASWQPLHVQLLLPGLDLLAQQFDFLSEDSVLTRPRSSRNSLCKYILESGINLRTILNPSAYLGIRGVV